MEAAATARAISSFPFAVSKKAVRSSCGGLRFHPLRLRVDGEYRSAQDAFGVPLSRNSIVCFPMRALSPSFSTTLLMRTLLTDRAIKALGVFELIVIAFRVDLGVMSGCCRVIDAQGVVELTADGYQDAAAER